MLIRDLWLNVCRLSLLRYKAKKCGHFTRRTGSISVFGGSFVMQMPFNDDGSVDYCLSCIGKMSIRCAWCSSPIAIGSPVTLYTPALGFVPPDDAVVFSTEPLRLVGCLGWDCAHSGADRGGFWLPGEDGKGYVMRVPTIFERMFCGGEPSMVIMNDTLDIKEALAPIRTTAPQSEMK